MIFKGIDSDTIEGLIICSEPPISSSGIRIKETTIDGRDGAIVEKLGYKARVRPAEIGLKRNADVDNILTFFSGEGDLIFNNEPDKVYRAAIYDQIDLERLLRLKRGKVNFYCQPFKYKKNDTYVVVTESVVNQGNYESDPIIKLEKGEDSSVELTINGVRFKYNFLENDIYVEIDCEKKTVLYEGLIRDRQLEIGYDFPKLKVGTNNIIVHSGDATIKIKRKDRWL